MEKEITTTTGKENGRGARQIILIRQDLPELKRFRGKLCAQACHASEIAAFVNLIKKDIPTKPDENGYYTYTMHHNIDALHYWLTNRFVKIVLGVKDEAEMFALYEKAKAKGMLVSKVQDAGFTVFNGPTYTAVAIGPAWDEEFIGLTDHLKTY